MNYSSDMTHNMGCKAPQDLVPAQHFTSSVPLASSPSSSMHCAISHLGHALSYPRPLCRWLSLSETFPNFPTCSPLQLGWNWMMQGKLCTSRKGPVRSSLYLILQSHSNLRCSLPSSSHISPLHTPVDTKFFTISSFPHMLFFYPRNLFISSILHPLNFYTPLRSHFT